MPIKNIRTVTALYVSDNDVEDAVNAFYGTKDFSVVADLEIGNDTTYEITVVAEPIDAYDQYKVSRMKAGKVPSNALRTLLQDMCFQGDIAPGRYFIRCAW